METEEICHLELYESIVEKAPGSKRFLRLGHQTMPRSLRVRCSLVPQKHPVVSTRTALEEAAAKRTHKPVMAGTGMWWRVNQEGKEMTGSCRSSTNRQIARSKGHAH